MRSKLVLWLLLVGLVLAVSACGPAATPAPSGPAEVTVTLTEFAITSSLTTLQVGTPYSFVVTNNGSIAHEILIEPAGAVDEPLEAGGREAEIEEEDLPAGASATLEWTFTEAGDFQLACHVVGHYEAGMVLPIVVQ